jgi:hypothetical protein
MAEHLLEETEDTDTEHPAQTRYFIDFDSYPQKNRSRDVLLRDRMCEESRSRLGEQVRTRGAVAEAEGGKVKFNTKGGRYGEDPIALIKECCAGKPEYRDPRLPLKEVIFRLLLANGNVPMTVEELRAAASEWTGFEYGGGITSEAVLQIMEVDALYGFAPAED